MLIPFSIRVRNFLDLLDHWVSNPSWRTLHRFGEFRIVGISTTALVAAPILSRGIVALKEWLGKVPYEETHLLATYMHLPKPYVLLLLSAVFALIGKSIYEAACPKFIKCGPDYHIFRHLYTEGLQHLAQSFVQLWNSPPEKHEEIKRIIADALQVALVSSDSTPIPRTITTETQLTMRGAHHRTGTIVSLLRFNEFGEEVFTLLRRMHDYDHRILRVACSACYILAIALVMVVIGMQLRWVYRAL